MNSDNREVEVKIYVPQLEPIRHHLEALGAELTHPRVYERNIRYDDENGRLATQHIVLRLREDSRVRVTYKEPATVERGISSREEVEVEVDDFDNMELILSKLGLHPALIYEKYRTTYEFMGAEVVLDELPYGNFVEVEASNSTLIERVLKKIGLQDVKRREHSYAKLFDFVKHHRELTFRDLTFENFADISVEEEDFIPPGSIVIS